MCDLASLFSLRFLSFVVGLDQYIIGDYGWYLALAYLTFANYSQQDLSWTQKAMGEGAPQ